MDCGYTGGLPPVFLEPCLLLLIKEQPSHGYDLVARVKSLGIDHPSVVYRTLRSLEQKSAIRSDWRFSDIGPARRVYELTAHGDQVLKGWVAVLEDTFRSIDQFLDRYADTCHSANLEPSTYGYEYTSKSQ